MRVKSNKHSWQSLDGFVVLPYELPCSELEEIFRAKALKNDKLTHVDTSGSQQTFGKFFLDTESQRT